MTLIGNVDVGRSIYSGEMTFRYLSCPACGGQLHSYPRLAHPHGHQLYVKCLRCTYAGWEQEVSTEIQLRMELERAGVTV